ncbi:acyl-CoA dehydrogenase domain protein (plasmid) [Azospirillum sp. B510]|uniref:acyl-CoA dehydrogenase family protein n=1 Tax=Azospirillum sp. (strain B510) TaxID=137722 RepID=UPI0001C4CC05|nr:acyl-CoA dehydrogenase family protein [Azospirillum sp. B510]BAI74859.1 acyl-CoA dehydrogenase domain protein [Azospirillum sp. B510]
MTESMSVGGMLADQLDRMLADQVTHALLSAAERGEFPSKLWGELEGMGVADAMVPEETGGAGLSWIDLEPVFHSLGHHAAPVPLGETIVGRWTLAAAGLSAPEGPLALVNDPLRLDRGGRLVGRAHRVVWAPHADHAVALATSEDDWQICLVPLEDIGPPQNLGSHATIARVPAADVEFSGRRPVRIAPAPAVLRKLGLKPTLAVLRSVQSAGGLDRVLRLSIEYGNTRVQFGRPISKFQAIQHMIAELAELTAAANVAGRIGCRAIDLNDCETGPAIAKCRIGASVTRGVAIAHQVFGAMGVTDEHVLHFVTRQLLQWREEGGSEHWWAERLGRTIVAGGGAQLWGRLTA